MCQAYQGEVGFPATNVAESASCLTCGSTAEASPFGCCFWLLKLFDFSLVALGVFSPFYADFIY